MALQPADVERAVQCHDYNRLEEFKRVLEETSRAGRRASLNASGRPAAVARLRAEKAEQLLRLVEDALAKRVPEERETGVPPLRVSFTTPPSRIATPVRKGTPSVSIDVPLLTPMVHSPPLESFPEFQNDDLRLEDFQRVKEGVCGEGHFAVVHVYRHIGTGELCALKQIRLASNDEGSRKVILTEHNLLKNIKHPNIVAFRGAFCHEASVFIALEYMDAGSLEDLVKGGPIPEKVIGLFALQILHGLQHLHKERIIHRDLKPSNVLVKLKGSTKIADFGVSSKLESSLEEARTYVGSFTYMSPDRIMGEKNTTYSYETDVWSLGLTLMECALGQYPYGSDCNYFRLVEIVVDGDAPRLHPNEKFSPEFCDFLDKCLQKVPGERWPVDKLLEHPFVRESPTRMTMEDLAGWVQERVKNGAGAGPVSGVV